METVAINEAFGTIVDVRERLDLRKSTRRDFLVELLEDLPELSDAECRELDDLREVYLYQSDGYVLTESTVNLLLLSPLVQLAGLVRPPYRIRAEVSVEITAEEEQRVYRGRIDTVVLRERFWILLVESKQTRFNFQAAVPQALVYMLGAPEPQRTIYGLVTNGDGFRFIKMVRSPEREYNLTEDFSVFATRNELYDVLRILKRIGALIVD
jgi:hypothetical protein